ncbi:MAG: helix-turn-helix domain-containing protein [Nocardioidaceae bacterium]
MPVNEHIPDYDLDEIAVITALEQLRALADPLRTTLLELLLEPAATVTKMARAVDRPKSTVAYHVKSLVETGLLRAVRTRRVRAIEERYYGRVARTLYIMPFRTPHHNGERPGLGGRERAKRLPEETLTCENIVHHLVSVDNPGPRITPPKGDCSVVAACKRCS